MATAPTNARPTPERIFNTLNAYQQTVALRAAIELDVFTAIADGATDVASIAKKTGAAERGIQTLCNYLTISEFSYQRKRTYRADPGVQCFSEQALACVHGSDRGISGQRSFDEEIFVVNGSGEKGRQRGRPWRQSGTER